MAQGVPIVAIPIAYRQPGTAARIAHHGVGEFIEQHELTTERLRGLIEKVLKDLSYRERADYFQKFIFKETWAGCSRRYPRKGILRRQDNGLENSVEPPAAS